MKCATAPLARLLLALFFLFALVQVQGASRKKTSKKVSATLYKTAQWTGDKLSALQDGRIEWHVLNDQKVGKGEKLVTIFWNEPVRGSGGDMEISENQEEVFAFKSGYAEFTYSGSNDAVKGRTILKIS